MMCMNEGTCKNFRMFYNQNCVQPAGCYVQITSCFQIYRSLNYLTIRICDNADPTACFTALCSMLKSALYDPRNQTVDLINKVAIYVLSSVTQCSMHLL